MSVEKETVIRRLNTARDLGKFMADYYYELDNAAKEGKKKIAWCTSVGPAELLRAMGFLVYFPETHSAMLGTTRMATDLIPAANAIGYSPEICSYLTADIGSFLRNVTPLSKAFPGIEKVPRPDVLVYNTNQCRDVQDWFSFYSVKFNVPMLGIHSYSGVGDVTPSHLSSIKMQIENMAGRLEKIIGKKLDMDRLRETVKLSRECSELWSKVLSSGSARPSPLSFFDGTTLMGPAVVGRGTQAATDCYKLLNGELEERIAAGVGVFDGERHRIYWDGMPVWGRLGAHSKLFAGLGANVIASTYCSSWIFSALDPADPFESMARAYTELFIVRDDEYKEKYIKNKLDFFHIDGIVYHNSKTCPNNTNCRYGLHARIEKETGVPSLVIDGDLNDLRCLSDEQTKTNVEAFIEQLEENR